MLQFSRPRQGGRLLSAICSAGIGAFIALTAFEPRLVSPASGVETVCYCVCDAAPNPSWIRLAVAAEAAIISFGLGAVSGALCCRRRSTIVGAPGLGVRGGRRWGPPALTAGHEALVRYHVPGLAE